MRCDSNQPLSSSSSHRHHQCPVLTRLYLSVDDDVHVCHDDDVSSTHSDDDHRQRRLFHVWAQYRIAQRGIMVSQSVTVATITIHYQCTTVAFHELHVPDVMLMYELLLAVVYARS